MTLQELAELVEGAEGPDRELDARIAPLVGLRIVDEGHPIGRTCYDDIGCAQLLPRYTASLDAAMSLLTDAGVLISLSEIKGDGMPMCIVGNPETAELFEAVAETMPLALCAASLKALSKREGEA